MPLEQIPEKSLIKYKVTYRYLATGMEGRENVEDYGIVEATNSKEACDIAAERAHPYDVNLQKWVRACLSAKEFY